MEKIPASTRLELEGALGSERAVDLFTVSRFKETPINSAALKAAVAFNPLKENLFFYGPTGAGKSHLAAIAIRQQKEIKIHNCSTFSPMWISRHVRACETAEQEDETIRAIAYRKILSIDDFGVGKDTEFSVSLFYEIINLRYGKRPGGLVLTSNLGIGELATKFGDDRISSRLAQMCKGNIFSLAGEKDWRV